jgi:hypothetical protein
MRQLSILFNSIASYLSGRKEEPNASSVTETSASYSKTYFNSEPLSELPWTEKAQAAILGRTMKYQATGLGEKEAQQNALDDYSRELFEATEALRPGKEPGKTWLPAPNTPEAEDYAYKAREEGRYPVDLIEAGKQYWKDYMKQVDEWMALKRKHEDLLRS